MQRRAFRLLVVAAAREKSQIQELLKEIETPRVKAKFVASLDEAEQDEADLSSRPDQCNLLLLEESQSLWDCLDRARTTKLHAPVIALVRGDATRAQEVGARALEAGAADYLLLGQLNADTLARSMRCALAVGELYQLKQRHLDQAFLAAIIESSRDAIFSYTPDGVISTWNHGAEELYGYAAAEAVGQSLEVIVPPTLHAENEVLLADIRSSRQPRHLETVRRRKDGSLIDVSLFISPVLDATGQVSGASVIARDISIQKQAQHESKRVHGELEERIGQRTAELARANAQLQSEIVERQMAMGALREAVEELKRAKAEAERAREEAELANLAKSEFLSRMSHELRTPMNSIIGFAQIMEMHPLEDKQAQRVAHILRAGRHLLQLINEVLDIARVESGQLSLSPEAVAAASVVEAAVELIHPLAHERQIAINLDCSGCQGIYVRADHQRLSQVLLNLLSNAIKYNRQNGKVRVFCQKREDETLRVSVEDTGYGLSAEQRERLFQPFERLGVENSAVEGTGLGLALSKRLIELMQGRLEVQSEVGAGSTFWLELPVVHDTGKSGGELPASGSALPPLDGAHTILYIEDNLANIRVIKDVLEAYPSVRLISAIQGRMALDLARDHHLSLILLDLHLPDLPGEEVLRRLKAEPTTRNVPIVIISADATPNQIKRLKAAGATEYLIKPLDIRLLLSLMHQLLHRDEDVSRG